jgi:hypothetical protein
MDYFAGLDVSVKETSVCIVDDAGKIVREARVASEECQAELRPSIRSNAIFRQINRGVLHMNHDALEFPDGEIVLLTRLCEGQKATVLTLPPQAKTAAAVEAQHAC